MVVWNAAEVRDEEWFKKFAPSTDMPISSHGSEANGVNGVPSADGKEADLAPTKLTMASSKEDEELLVLQKRLDRLLTRRASVNRTLDLLVARSKLLTLAEDRISTLPPIRSAADDTAPRNSKKSKSKSGGGDANNGGGSRAGPRCGYDERLSWDDERWGAWIGSETGQRVLRELEPLDGHLSPGSPEEENEQTQSRTDERGAVADEPAVCGVPRRKCARHADWSVVRGADFEVEREVQVSVARFESSTYPT